MIPQIQSRQSIPVALSLGMVLSCLAVGGCFIWWYLPGVSNSPTIKLSPEEIARMTYQSNGGIPPRFNQGMAFRPAPEPDGIYPAGTSQEIRVGQVRFTLSGGQPPAVIAHQRTWGLLRDQTTFTIARRVCNEPALVHQLAITPDQLAKLQAIGATAVVRGRYVAALPMTAVDSDRLSKAWLDYAASSSSKTADAPARAKLLQTAGEIATSCFAKAQQDYADAAKAIGAILTPEQIQAFRQGKSLAGT